LGDKNRIELELFFEIIGNVQKIARREGHDYGNRPYYCMFEHIFHIHI